jgi:hypothetical protein
MSCNWSDLGTLGIRLILLPGHCCSKVSTPAGETCMNVTPLVVIGENLEHDQPVEIRVFASPTDYMLTSSGFPFLNWGILYKFL